MSCKVCDGYVSPYQTKARSTGMCFTCYYWTELIAAVDCKRVVCNNRHYTIQSEGGKGLNPNNVFGGQQWIVVFFDQTIVKTNDLYSQGEVPERFHNQLPNNAVLLQVIGNTIIPMR